LDTRHITGMAHLLMGTCIERRVGRSLPAAGPGSRQNQPGEGT
jgi:hypothetical protein